MKFFMLFLFVNVLVASSTNAALLNNKWNDLLVDLVPGKGDSKLNGDIIDGAIKSLFNLPVPIPGKDCVKQKLSNWVNLFNKLDLFSNMTIDDFKEGFKYPCGALDNLINYDGAMRKCVNVDGDDPKKCHDFVTQGGVLANCLGDSVSDLSYFFYDRLREQMNCPPCPKLFALNTTLLPEEMLNSKWDKQTIDNYVKKYENGEINYRPDMICMF